MPSHKLTSLSREEYEQRFEEALLELRRYDTGLEKLHAYALSRPELFPRARHATMSETQRYSLREIWRALLDYMRAIDGIKAYWKDHRGLDERFDRRRAFMISYLSWLTQYRYGMDFIRLTVPSEPLEILLDEEDPEFEIPPNTFARLKWNMLNVEALRHFLVTHRLWKLKRSWLKKRLKAPEAMWAFEKISTHKASAVSHMGVGQALRFLYQAFDITRDFAYGAWFPLQSSVAQWMGDTKIKRLYSYLIDDERVDNFRTQLEPGDIVFSRKNWYLSNVGLPGFWPHAALYVGTPNELLAMLGDVEVAPHHTLREYLETTHANAWNAYISGPSPSCMLEAMSEGVVFTCADDAFAADYLAAVRPRRTPLDRARAVIRAFQYHGRPYDFDFDFVSDASIVCSELVYKAWQRDDDHNGVHFDLIDYLGRRTLPTNDMVSQVCLNLMADELSDYDFVAFVRGHEGLGSATFQSQEVFEVSWRQSRWETPKPTSSPSNHKFHDTP